ncbi:MAG: outer membrane channel protein [Planctomycetota bacterium]|nr:MAG: outer membrane channel protein [Planctomycetota bacterium]
MCSRLVNDAARARSSSRAKLICWSGALTAACLAYSAWAGPQDERSSNRTPRLDQRSTVQLGFIANDDPANAPQSFGQPVPQPIAPNAVPFEFAAPPTSVPVAPSFPASSVSTSPELARPTHVAEDDDAKPQDLSGPWWGVFVTAPLRENAQPVTLSIEEILVRAIHHSSQVKVFSDLPLIRETSIVEADAAFDWTAFLDSRWQDLNDPVGSTLTIGTPGVSRYKNEQYTGQGGVRKRTREGGTLQLSEQLGWQQTNSTYFVPNPQGTSRLVLGYTHPLMRGAGQIYNESLICLAELDTKIASDEFSRQLQSHLLEVLRAYWGLYLERANLAQKLQSLKRAADTLALLKQRQQLDAVPVQILRAKAEVASRRSQVIRAQMGVKNAEDRIRALVNDPAFGDYDTVELIPTEAPTITEIPLSMPMALTTAATTRPEVNQALRQIQAGCTRLNMSKNEVLPMLNLVTEAYVAGLQENSPFSAFNNGFTTGAPGYTVGVQFEMPLGNRAPQARRERRELELRQLRNQYQTTLNTLQLEVKVSVREVETALAEMLSQHRAMEASTAELKHLEQRFERLPGEDGNASLMLDNLLLAQNRLATNEFNFLTAEVTYNLALHCSSISTASLSSTNATASSSRRRTSRNRLRNARSHPNRWTINLPAHR